nr:MAG TPA: hypothetical protein [Bacteriophage sp.]
MKHQRIIKNMVEEMLHGLRLLNSLVTIMI